MNQYLTTLLDVCPCVGLPWLLSICCHCLFCWQWKKKQFFVIISVEIRTMENIVTLKTTAVFIHPASVTFIDLHTKWQFHLNCKTSASNNVFVQPFNKTTDIWCSSYFSEHLFSKLDAITCGKIIESENMHVTYEKKAYITTICEWILTKSNRKFN